MAGDDVTPADPNDAAPAASTPPNGRLRFSLLTPGAVALRLARLDWLLLAGLYVFALAVRWGLRDIHPYTAEATHFLVAKGLWHSTTNIRYPDILSPGEDYSWFFWQRPLLTLPFWPAAQHSFLAYRTMNVVLVSAFPALGAWLLRSLGVGRAYAVAAAIVLAVHPALLPWTVLMLPDALVLTLILAALLAAHHGRPAATALVLLAASWVKEVAFVASLTLVVLALWRGADGRRTSLRPFHVDRFAWWLAPVVPLAFLPLWLSTHFPGYVRPGFRPGGDEALMFETLWLLVYLAPIPLLALVRKQTRRFALVAMAWPAFFLAYHYTQDKAIESWYNVIPGSMTVLAAAAGLWALGKDAPQRRRLLSNGLAVVLGMLLLVQLNVPDNQPANAEWITPWSHRGQWDYEQVRDNQLARDDDLFAVMAVPGPDERHVWAAQDVDWSLIMYPIASETDTLVKIYSWTHPLNEREVRGWGWAVENLTDALIVYERDDIPINYATRHAYAQCATTVGKYTVVPADACRGKGASIWEHYLAASRPSSP